MGAQLGKVGVIFDSGAFYGAFGAGVAKAIWQRGIKPIAIGGTSVGALNAAKVSESNSMESVRELEKIWLYIEKHGPGTIFRKLDVLKNLPFHHNRLYNTAGLEGLLALIDAHKLVEAETLLQIVVREEISEDFVIISNKDEDIQKNPSLIKEYVKASASVAGAFPPVKMGSRVYSDGLVFWPLIESFAAAGCDTIFVAMNDQKRNPDYTDESWDLRIFRVVRRCQTEMNKRGIDAFLEKNVSFEPFGYEVEDDDPLMLKGFKKLKNWVIVTKTVMAEILEGSFDGIKHRLIFIFPHCYIPTFYPTKFRPGDLTLAMQRSFEEANRILDKLEVS